MTLTIRPITLKQAKDFVRSYHRHNKAPVGHKFSVGLFDGATLIGVGTLGRPVARAYDDGTTAEITRTCTDGTPNANSMIYGAVRRAASAMGYVKLITYTQEGESGASLRAAGFRKDAELSPRRNWHNSSQKLRHTRDSTAAEGVARVRWVWP